MIREPVRPPSCGFTLTELVVALAVAGAIVAFLGVVASRAMQSSREIETRDQVQEIYSAIVGDPANGRFGFLGDMGRLPVNLAELATRGTQVAYHLQDGGTPHAGNVGTGWRGPYVTAPVSSSDIFTDAWGQPLSYADTGGTAGQIVSGGADAVVGNSDDVRYPVQLPINTTGTLVVTVLVNDIAQPSGLTVNVYTTSNGEQGTPMTMTTAAAGAVPFSFTVAHGLAVVKATHTAGSITVTRTVTVAVPAGTQVATTVAMSTSATVSM